MGIFNDMANLRNNQYVLTVTMNPALDIFVTLPEFQIGKTYIKEKVENSAGGKGVNSARVLKALGVPVMTTGILGGYAGQLISTYLKKESLPMSFVWMNPESRMNLTIISAQNKKSTRLLEAGEKVPTAVLEAFKHKYELLLKRSSLVIISGRLAQGMSNIVYARLIQMAKHRCIPVILDAAGLALKQGCRKNPFLVTPNIAEAEDVLKQPVDAQDRYRTALKRFCSFGAERAAISLGDKGVVGFDGRDFWAVKPPRVNTIFDVGCGDAFNAGFAYGYLRSAGFADCLCYGVAAGTANAYDWQPGRIQKNLFQKLLKQIRVSRI